jgi:hypothetical protein
MGRILVFLLAAALCAGPAVTSAEEPAAQAETGKKKKKKKKKKEKKEKKEDKAAAKPAEPVATGLEQEFFADLIVEDSGPKIKDLKWGPELLRVRRTALGEEYRSFVVVRGQYSKDGWTLSTERSIVELKDGGEFEVEVPLSGKITFLSLMAIGPYGEVETQKVGIYFAEVVTFKEEAKTNPVKRYFLSPGLSMTSIAFKDSRIADFSETALTGKISFLTPVIPPRWDAGVTVYMTLLPLTTSTDKMARFLGVNLRFGYVVPSVTDPWKLTLLTGGYYTTMFVSTNDFGFKNMSGPQLFPMLARTLKNRDTLVGYLKFSPIGGSFRILSLANNEKAFGMSYVRPLAGGRSIAASLDIANLSLTIQGVNLSSTSFSLGVGYGL